MKKILALILCAVLVFAMASCGAAPASSGSVPAVQGNSEAGVNTITDHLGRTVTVPNDVQRIAVCGVWPLPSVLAVFFNSADKIVGMPPQCMTAAENGLLGELYPEILNAQTEFAAGDEINTEELLKLQPDVVFFSASTPAVGEKLEAAGFCAVAVSVNGWEYNCIETLNQWVELFSQIFPEDAKAEKVQQYSEDIYQLVQSRVKDIPQEERARVFFLFQYSDTMLSTSGEKFFGQWWADAIGAENVAKEITTDNAATINMEQVYQWNPDTIFITNFNPAQPEDLYKNTVGSYDWGSIDAVAQERVFKFPLGIYRGYTPGADTPMTLLWMAKCTYPEKFADIDMTQQVKDYYADVYGVQLTTEQAESIFKPTAAASAF